MKKYLKLTAIGISLLIALTGCGNKGDKGASKGAPMGAPNMQQQSDTTTAVNTMEITKSSISTEYMYSGTIQPSTQVNVLSTVSGKVASVNYDVGDRVNKGDVLFTMDTTDIINQINVSKASVTSAEANVKSARTNLELVNGASMQSQIESAKNQITSAETNIKNTKVSLDNAKIALDKAESDYNTNESLYNAGGLSKESLDNYKNSYDQAKNNYEQAELSYQQAQDSLEQAQTNYDIVANKTPQENIKKAQDSLNSALAQKSSADAQLVSAQKSLSDATVTSPISGTVLECNVTAGASLGNTTPFVIIDLDTVNIEVNVSEQMINSINVGDAVKIKVNTLSDEMFNGSISTIAPGANSDGTYTVKLEINNESGALKSGMFAEVYFTKDKSDSTVVLPRSAVLNKNDEYYVFVTEGTTAKKVVVEVGIDNGDEIEVKSGLSEGMKVVIKGQTYLKDGDTINDVTNLNETESSQTENSEQLSQEQQDLKETPQNKEAKSK